MEMQGSRTLAVTQQQAWDALNDPAVLQACIPGCESIQAAGPDQYKVVVAVRIGPVAARFNGRIAVADVNPPNSYTLNFEGQAGPAGFGKGVALVRLSPPAEGSGCELGYSATAQVGGRIAQVGQRLVDGVARSMAQEFFQRFEAEMQRRHPPPVAIDSGAARASPMRPAARNGLKTLPPWAWLWAVVALLAVAAALRW
jgi:uncharacterized protein